LADNLTAGGVPVYIDTAGVVREKPQFSGVVSGGASAASSDTSNLDTNGNPVPVNRQHTFTYDASGNLSTDTVSDGTGTWVRTYGYQGGNQVSDSGWVKQ
jgi:YD repeat-containing protein